MSIKITIPNTSSDVLTFGSANTPTAAQIAGIDSGSSNGQLALYTTASGTSTERVRIDASGNVGIGVTPSAFGSGFKSLQMNGGSLMAYNGTNMYYLNNTYYDGTNYKYVNNGFATIYTQTSGVHAWSYAASGTAGNTVTLIEAMRIDTSGNLLVGTTSTDSGRMCVEAQTNGYAITFRRNTGVYGSNTKVGQISCDSTSTAYATSSDYRLKNTIAPMTGALAKVALLKPCTYKWNADGSDGQGFIAHELQEVVEGCVTGEKDAVDAEGNPVYQGIDTSFLVATLVAAIQELKAEVDALKGTK